MAVSTQVIFEIALAIMAVLNAVIIYPVYRKLNRDEKTSMASFQLNPHDTMEDFKIFFAGTIFFIVASSTLFYGDAIGNNTIFQLGNVLSVLSSLVPLYIFYRWWRRFR